MIKSYFIKNLYREIHNKRMYTQRQLTSSIIMVRPHDFGFNEQTGLDNEFQHRPSSAVEASDIARKSMSEFEQMVNKLDEAAVQILVLDKPDITESLPDAVFPNNWFSTTADGRVVIFPMKTPNRQLEVQKKTLIDLLSRYNYQVAQVIDLRKTLNTGETSTKALEGTGSLIFHYPSSSVFAALSERCDEGLLTQFSKQFDYEVFPFASRSNSGKPVYHTNVLMSCGKDFAVIAEQNVVKERRSQKMLTRLHECVSDIITITEQQMSEYFCGNILQIMDKDKQPMIIMSDSALKGFSKQQQSILEKHGTIFPCSIPTIEYIGGGSARCMIAENFLPK